MNCEQQTERILVHFVQGNSCSLVHLGMHEETIPYWEHSEFQTLGVNYTGRFHMCSLWPLKSGIYLPPGWVTLHVLFTDRGLKWGCRECNTDLHDLWPRKAAWSTAHQKLLTPSYAVFQRRAKPFAHSICLLMPNDLHPFFIHVFVLSLYTYRCWSQMPTRWSLKWEDGKERRRGETVLLSGPVSTGHMSSVICH